MSAPASGSGGALLRCQRRDLGGAVCLALSGELDLASVPLLRAELSAAAETADAFVVDLAGLRYIDSSGVKALLDGYRTFARTGRRIVLAAPSPMTQRILDVLNVGQIVPIYPTVDAALEALRSEGPTP